MALGSKLAVTAVATTALLGPAVAAPAVAAPAQTGKVTVVHGVPRVAVDVYANNTRVLSNFRFGTVTRPLTVATGRYTFAVRPAGAARTTKPLLTTRARVRAGSNSTVVAHLKAAGNPTISVFANPTGRLAAGKARLVVRHTAAAPAVDVYAGNARVIRGLANGQQKTLVVNAGTVSVKVTPAGRTNAVLGPARLTLRGQDTTIAYAIGSARGGSLRLVGQAYVTR